MAQRPVDIQLPPPGPFMPQPPGRRINNLGGLLNGAHSNILQLLSRQAANGFNPLQGFHSNPLQAFQAQAPPGQVANDRAGNITQAPGYAQGTHDPSLWIQRHPAATQSGNIPPWVVQDMFQGVGQGGGMDPHQVLNDVVNFHRQGNGLQPLHPDELHQRITNLAHEITGSRQNRVRQALRSIVPPRQANGIVPPAAPTPFPAAGGPGPY